METASSAKAPGRIASLFSLQLFLLLGCTQQQSKDEMHILVAASTRNVVQASIDAYMETKLERDRPTVVLVSGPSNGLAKQIESGAKAHIFVSASPAWTESIKGQCSQIDVLVRNRIVLATPAESPVRRLRDLSQVEINRIAVATKSVPVGHYANQVLESIPEAERAAVFDKLVFAKDASALIAWLESGVVDAAFVYASDIEQSRGAFDSLTVDENLYDPVVYTIAALRSPNDDSFGQLGELYEWFLSERSRTIFKEAGFQLPSRNISNEKRSITVE